MAYTCLFVIFLGVSHWSCGPEVPDECKTHYSQPSYERDHAFRDSYSIEKQLIVYRCAMQRKPPEFGLAAYIAERGDKNLPIILAALKAEGDEPTKVGMFYIFEIMSQKKLLRGKPETIDQLKQVADSMHSEVGRREARESIDRIIQYNSN